MEKRMSPNTHECFDITELLETTERLNHKKDIDSLLDSILLEVRLFTKAEGGSIFLTENNLLHFSYVQNDSHSQKDPNSNKHIYTKFSLPISDDSIAGYVALTGEPLNIADAYNIPSTVPYGFNAHFDKLSSYHTKSILTVPLKTSSGNIIGVLQLINSTDNNGNIKPFTNEHQLYANFFASNASIAIERARMTRKTILRMVKMTELRDPKETGNHVNRVGSYAVEIYERWARKKGEKDSSIRKFKDSLKIAAMLHDVGKIAIPDAILKKPAKLDDEEYKTMKTHSFQGAKLFDRSFSELDSLCYDVAYTHHEKWDGSGYPRGLEGEDIPLAGRIVALADVYDALICKRVYKDSWAEENVLEFIKETSGMHFDPEIVKAFFDTYEVIKAIRKRYSE